LFDLAWVGCTEVREPPQQIAVRLEPVGRDLALGDEGQSMCDDVVGKETPVGSGPKETSAAVTICLPTASAERASGPVAR
jgi:hypothetical protein